MASRTSSNAGGEGDVVEGCFSKELTLLLGYKDFAVLKVGLSFSLKRLGCFIRNI